MHYHGTPITPRQKLLELAGRSFCVSYARPDDAEVCHDIGQSVMLDNGAFSFWRNPTSRLATKATAADARDWAGYFRWCERWLQYGTTWAVIPDVIDGTEEHNDALIDQWPFGQRGAPVWHLHEPLERLVRLARGWPLVCLGSSGDYATLQTTAWHRRMAEAMDVVTDPRGVPLTRLHMLRGLALAGGPYPFASADSTNIARNHAGNDAEQRLPRPPRVMADEIDARQCPPRWRRDTFDQLTLDAA